jgi:hypothetical protein
MKTMGGKGAVVGALVLAQIAAARSAPGDERPRTSSTVQAPAQGGGGVEPVPGAPPAIEPSLERKPARATLAPGPRPARADTAVLRDVSLAPGEATLEIDGAREVVRPGSRIGGDTVKLVEPGRLVLERPAKPGQTGGPALVIVTFDEAGRGKTRAFWTADPEALRPAEVKRP